MRREALTALAIAALFGLALVINRSGLDLAITRLAFDASAGRFPWRDEVLFARVLHDGLKWAAVGMEVFVLAALAIAWARPASAPGRYRGALSYLAVASLASALAVSVLKNLSSHSCPWDLALFGGAFDFFRFLDPLPPNPGPGRCAPSGHASVGFMWIAAIYAFDWPTTRVRSRARWVALAVVALGALVSIIQVVRGAHFASHTLMTAGVCWLVAWLMSFPRRRESRPSREASRPGATSHQIKRVRAKAGSPSPRG